MSTPIIIQKLSLSANNYTVVVPCPNELKLFDYNFTKLIIKIENAYKREMIFDDITNVGLFGLFNIMKWEILNKREFNIHLTLFFIPTILILDGNIIDITIEYYYN